MDVNTHQRVQLAQHEHEQVELVVPGGEVDKDKLAQQLLAHVIV